MECKSLKIIAGPCSIESRQQLMETASQLKSLNLSYLRGGAWKPRSRPGDFEGLGAMALEWLLEVKHNLNLKTMVEVATPEHLYLAHKFQVDAVWIGARTVSNPFAVQALADFMKEQKIKLPVFVKNPMHPDLNLWLGALERFQKIGVEVSAIHRGFSQFHQNTDYRFAPLWRVPMELKRRMPDLEIICDPSHMAGKRELVSHFALRAIQLGFNGLMIESHHHPERALSDAAQQLTPQALKNFLSALPIDQSNSDSSRLPLQASLQDLRDQIDAIDRELLENLKTRMQLARQISIIKKQQQQAVFQPERMKELFNQRESWAAELGLEQDAIRELFTVIHEAAVREQLNH